MITIRSKKVIISLSILLIIGLLSGCGDNSINENSSIKVTAINSISGNNVIEVAYGTNKTEALPDTVEVTLSNNETASIPVNWNDGEPTYDKNTSGTYTFKGTLDLSDKDYSNPDNLMATVDLVVKEKNEAPTIDISKSTDNLTTTLTGSVADSGGTVKEVVIDWGDDTTSTITSDFGSIEQSHNYADSGEYTITVTATDNDGATTSQTITVTVEEISQVDPGKMVPVSAGTAADGSTSIGYDIEMGKYEVTHTEFIQFLNGAGVASDGSYEGKEMIDMDDSNCAIEHDGSFYFAGSRRAESEDCPVIEVTWYGAVAYCNWLSEEKGLNKAYDLNNWELKDNPENLESYRLPTETEWEYVARGGVDGNNTTYAGSDIIGEVAWYYYNSRGKTHPVGEKKPNELGIYDMSGNVSEWTNTPSGSYRAHCGGGWSDHASHCEVDSMFYSNASYSFNRGFRLTKTK